MARSYHAVTLLSCLTLIAMPGTALGKNIQVQMKNKGKDGFMVFEPAFVKANVGDVVTFLPTDASHNAESIPIMAPKGTPPFKGVLNKQVAFTVTKPGLYGIKCAPHLGMGMVALVQAGDVTPGDVVAARAIKLPPLAAKRMTAALAMVK